ncbi:MAG: RNA polymerase sigma factor [Bacteroidales bacterium]|nr:RNA polymerase sigma factor [Bacteroidales bacterium]MBO7646950.1 RNA polymerase sigma factor [Bacteroidales bacterium]
MMTSEEKDIINGCRRGDQSCQEQLYKTYGPIIKAVCYRYVGYQTEEAKDLFHDIVVTILTNIHAYKMDSSLKSWIYRISVNKCIDFLRSQNLRKTAADEETMMNYPSSERQNDTLTMDQIIEIINTLPVNQKMAFNLYEVDGFNEREIVEIMGMTPTNVRTLISRAKQSLRKRIQAYLGKEIEIL